MKYIACFLFFFALQAKADVTPEQYNKIVTETYNVMYQVGAEAELGAEILDIVLLDQLGDRVKVQFTYEEEMYGERTCTYYYDLKAEKAISKSWLCRTK